MEEVLQRLEAERYGPIVREPAMIPHLPPAAYTIDAVRELAALEEAERAETERVRAIDQATRDRRRYHEQRRERSLPASEIEQAV
jgi:hypothetical protein